MDPKLRQLLDGRTLLLAVAAEIEAGAVAAGLGIQLPHTRSWAPIQLVPQVELVMTGVGKACAAGGVAHVLDPARHAGVLSIGIAGGYPPTQLGATVVASASVFADEGVATLQGFEDLAKLGFPPTATGISVPAADSLIEALRPHADAVGPIATVSTCSGTDALAQDFQRRTGALAEAMEGAAIALVAQRFGVPFGELRVISNTTGNRHQQTWRIKDALSTLSRVIGSLFAES